MFFVFFILACSALFWISLYVFNVFLRGLGASCTFLGHVFVSLLGGAFFVFHALVLLVA